MRAEQPEAEVSRPTLEDPPAPGESARPRGPHPLDLPRPSIPPRLGDELLIELEEVEKTFRVGSSEIRALAGVSFDVSTGDYLAVTGPSGSGKSTLMNVIGCLDTPTAGSYRLRGAPVHLLDDDTLAMIRNQVIGFVFQNFNLLPRLDALRNVEVPLLYGSLAPTQRLERAAVALQRVGLGHRTTHLPNALSGGERQRVAIARALVNQPALLLADEPTGNLDSRTAEEIMSLFDELAAGGTTILVVTHDREVAAHAHREIAMRDGRIV